MKALTEPLKELSEFREAREGILRGRTPIHISGCVDTQKCHLINGLGEGYKYKVIITYSEAKARELYDDMKLYGMPVFLYPSKDIIFYSADVHGHTIVKERMQVMKQLLSGSPAVIITTLDVGMEHCIPLSCYENRIIRFAEGEDIDPENLRKELSALGYEYGAQVDMPGQFAVRGGIIDIFPLTEEVPYRIELWGDTISSIHSFDVESQRSIEPADEFVLYSATEIMVDEERILRGLAKIGDEVKKYEKKYMKEHNPAAAGNIRKSYEQLKENIEFYKGMAGLESYLHYFYDRTESFYEYFDRDETVFFIDEPNMTYDHGKAVYYEYSETMKSRLEKGYVISGQLGVLYNPEQVYARLENTKTVMLSVMDTRPKHIAYESVHTMSVQSVQSYNGKFDIMVKDLERWKKNGYRVLVFSPSTTRAKRLGDNLGEYGLAAFYSDDPERTLDKGEIMTAYGAMHKGFYYPQIRFAVVTEADIFGEKKTRKKHKRYSGKAIQSFSEINVGDYVVHENHGLGIYRGIEKIEVDRIIKDYLKIEYAKDGVLYIPATGLSVLQKYSAAAGNGKRKPKLNNLNTREWHNTKARVRSEIKDIAKDLAELYAKRQEKKGYCYGEDTVWQKEFEEMFPYEETQDQLNAIVDTKRDMQSTRIMDRLICGDVGYGKTEIALRAAFKAATEGKQTAYLVPTTILAQQHYNTFVERMQDFPVNVAMLSRFCTPADNRKTIAKLKKGNVDIVIGTHRLLSKDVVFRELGLLIIDEEQRFGVTHKEKIKQMKENVDVLTLSATPIPRTLHMSLAGIRDMSVLDEPPIDRLPVQTFVMEHNDEIIREAIMREISRGGQVYYVYNRVNNIDVITNMVAKLVPEATVSYAHGQMSERVLENIMFDFIHGDIDVLVSTTIIETGLDIANVNTIIIDEADRMGLSQLYQLRGRVGRSNRTAYAFLMYKRDKMLKEEAEKRLAAIKEFTDLGSGFKIAMRDLEIRGAGNILGAEQHGHIEAVGYDLYCKMLNEAVEALKGGKEEPEETYETSVDMEVDAYIPASYIKSEYHKLEMYKRIADIENEEEMSDCSDELKDRFGDYPEAVQNLMEIALIKSKAHAVYVTQVTHKKDKSSLKAKKPQDVITFMLYENALIDINKIPLFLEGESKRLRFEMEGKPRITYRLKDGEDLFDRIKELLDKMKIMIMGDDTQI